MRNPFFSVILPAHNSAQFIRKTLDSIKMQDWWDYELIVIADNCTDNTAEIAREYTDKVYEEHFGRCGLSRNKGLDVATGEWVLWTDDDDWWLHEFAFTTIANATQDLKPYQNLLAYGFVWKGMGLAYNMPNHLYPAIWNKAWKRSFIGDDRFPNVEHSDDAGWAQKMHPKANVEFLFTPLYYYNYMRPGSTQDKIAKGEIKSVEEVYRE